ncbi:hypothetical protein TNCV_2529001 [Trichonephila clavipes]|nr:hypothetical protein TNCV_2529001 [Trichonephila clavipes]
MGTSCFGLRIASWNANGVRSRTVEFRDFIDKHHPDIVLIQETHLGPGDTFQIPNFPTYRNDKLYAPYRNLRVGTAIILKSSLPPPHTDTTIELGQGYFGYPHPAQQQSIANYFNLRFTLK